MAHLVRPEHAGEVVRACSGSAAVSGEEKQGWEAPVMRSHCIPRTICAREADGYVVFNGANSSVLTAK